MRVPDKDTEPYLGDYVMEICLAVQDPSKFVGMADRPTEV